MMRSAEDLKRIPHDELVKEHVILLKQHTELQSEHKRLTEEFEQYKHDSRELELCLEQEVEETQNNLRSVINDRDRIRAEYTRFKGNHEVAQQIEEDLRIQLKELNAHFEKSLHERRRLEIKTDILERNERNWEYEKKAIQRMYDSAVEKMVLMQFEIDIKDDARLASCRPKEEVRLPRPCASVEPVRADPFPIGPTPDQTPDEMKGFSSLAIDSMDVEPANTAMESALDGNASGTTAHQVTDVDMVSDNSNATPSGHAPFTIFPGFRDIIHDLGIALSRIEDHMKSLQVRS